MMKATKLLLISTIALTSLAGAKMVQAEDANTLTTTGLVTFEASNDPNTPIDPNNPGNEVTPIDPTEPGGVPPVGTTGPLSIDFASSVVFGLNKISGQDETYYANAQALEGGEYRGNYVQVTDKRGSNAGWKLIVKQDGQFRNISTLNQELNGAQLSFSEPAIFTNTEGVDEPTATPFVLDPEGEASTVMVAEENAGAGTWINMFGNVSTIDGVEKNTAITLEIPGKIAKDAVSYGTKLNWTILDSPGNE